MNILDQLYKFAPHGHPDFVKMSVVEMGLHSRKNKDYARGGDPLGNFKRVAAIMKLYPDIDWATPVGVGLVCKLKQLDAALWQLSQGFEGEVEGFDERMQDDGIYSKIIRILRRE